MFKFENHWSNRKQWKKIEQTFQRSYICSTCVFYKDMYFFSNRNSRATFKDHQNNAWKLVCMTTYLPRPTPRRVDWQQRRAGRGPVEIGRRWQRYGWLLLKWKREIELWGGHCYGHWHSPVYHSKAFRGIHGPRTGNENFGQMTLILNCFKNVLGALRKSKCSWAPSVASACPAQARTSLLTETFMTWLLY